MTQDEMIDEFHRVHGETYDYSAVVYKNKGTKVIINCSIHGEFLYEYLDSISSEGVVIIPSRILSVEKVLTVE